MTQDKNNVYYIHQDRLAEQDESARHTAAIVPAARFVDARLPVLNGAEIRDNGRAKKFDALATTAADYMTSVKDHGINMCDADSAFALARSLMRAKEETFRSAAVGMMMEVGRATRANHFVGAKPGDCDRFELQHAVADFIVDHHKKIGTTTHKALALFYAEQFAEGGSDTQIKAQALRYDVGQKMVRETQPVASQSAGAQMQAGDTAPKRPLLGRILNRITGVQHE